MADSTIQEQLNRVESVSLATDVPRHDALAVLLSDEGIRAAYSARGTVDATDTRNVELRTAVNGRPEIILRGLTNDATVDLSLPVISTSSAMIFTDKQGQFVRAEQEDGSMDLTTQTGSVRGRSSDAAGNQTLNSAGSLQMGQTDNSNQAVVVSRVIDAAGKEHNMVDLTRTSLDNKISTTDSFLVKDGIDPTRLTTLKDLTADKIAGVIHYSEEIVGSRATFDLQIQPARDIAFPALERGA